MKKSAPLLLLFLLLQSIFVLGQDTPTTLPIQTDEVQPSTTPEDDTPEDDTPEDDAPENPPGRTIRISSPVLPHPDIVDPNNKMKEFSKRRYALLIDASANFSANEGATLVKLDENGIFQVVKPGAGIRRGATVSAWLVNANQEYFDGASVTSSFSNYEFRDLDEPNVFDPKKGMVSIFALDGGNPAALTQLEDYAQLGLEMERIYNELASEPFLDNTYLQLYIAQISGEVAAMGFATDPTQWLLDIDMLLHAGASQDESLYENAQKAAAYFYKISAIKTYIKLNEIPIQIKNSDEWKLEVTMNGKDATQLKKTVYEYRVKGGFQIDIAPVFALHGLKDHSYAIKNEVIADGDTSYFRNDNGTVNTDSITAINDLEGYRLIKDNNPSNLGGMGIGTLFHAYVRTGTIVNVSLSTGTFVDLENEAKFRFMFGGSLLIGDGNTRFSLSGGVVMGKVDRLGTLYAADVFTAGTLTEVPMRSEMACSWYVALGYNIPLVKKEKKD